MRGSDAQSAYRVSTFNGENKLLESIKNARFCPKLSNRIFFISSNFNTLISNDNANLQLINIINGNRSNMIHAAISSSLSLAFKTPYIAQYENTVLTCMYLKSWRHPPFCKLNNLFHSFGICLVWFHFSNLYQNTIFRSPKIARVNADNVQHQ